MDCSINLELEFLLFIRTDFFWWLKRLCDLTWRVILAIATEIYWSLQVLGIVVGVLLQDHDVRQSEFQQLPYHRIFIMLLLELNAPEHVLETINFQTLTAFWYVFESGHSAPLFLVGSRFFTWRLIWLFLCGGLITFRITGSPIDCPLACFKENHW